MKFANTTAVLAKFDAGQADREAAWNKVETDTDIWDAAKADNAALRAVREAYYEDTKGMNRYADCMTVDLGFMRRMVDMHKQVSEG